MLRAQLTLEGTSSNAGPGIFLLSCPRQQHTSNSTQGAHLGVGSIGDTARCMVMGLVKYTRYPEGTGHGIKIMQQGGDYSGVVQLK